jgi:hypothetical protein
MIGFIGVSYRVYADSCRNGFAVSGKSLHKDVTMRAFHATIMIVCFASGIAAQEPADVKWDPSTDLKAMQGEWRLDPKKSQFFSKTELDSIVKEPERQLSSVQFKGNEIYLSDGTALRFTNDLRSAGVKAALKGLNTICFIEPHTGTAYVGAYSIIGDSLVVRYPYHSTCSRSGNVAIFTRSKAEKLQN